MVLLDTNALILPFRAPFPLVAEIHRLLGPADIRVPASVLGELRRLMDERVPGARPARELAERFPIEPTDARGDRALVELARSLPAAVVTGDRALAARLRAAGAVVLAPRGRTRLEMRRTGPAPGGGRGPRRATVKKRPPVVDRPAERGENARRRR